MDHSATPPPLLVEVASELAKRCLREWPNVTTHASFSPYGEGGTELTFGVRRPHNGVFIQYDEHVFSPPGLKPSWKSTWVASKAGELFYNLQQKMPREGLN